MKSIIMPLGRLAVLTVPVLLAVSCGNQKSLEAAFMAGKKVGQTNTINKDDVVATNEEASQNEAVVEEAPVIETTTTATSAPSYTTTTDYPSTPTTMPVRAPVDVPGVGPHLGLGASLPFAGSFPYYCDPTSYPAHVIRAIAACRPFLTQIFPAGIPWTDLYSYRAPGYRYRHHLDRSDRRFDDDDDGNDRDGRRKRFRR